MYEYMKINTLDNIIYYVYHANYLLFIIYIIISAYM